MNRECYTNPCGGCGGCSSCGGCKCGKRCKQKDCACTNKLGWVPHTKCTMYFKEKDCISTLNLCAGIKNCETVTHMNWNNQTGCIEYENEKYLSSDGVEGALERICVTDFLPFINLIDLNDVDYDDTLDGTCYELIRQKDISCGDGCKSRGDRWVNWNIHSPGALVDSVAYIRGAGDDGCPVYLDKPENCAIMVHSPSCVAPTGEAQWYVIPRAGDCEMEPDDDGYYKVVRLNDCGCLEECRLPVMPPGMTAINYQRDSVPDDPDFPWYYGNYNDKINLHLAQNAAKYFGKYDLKITVNYGVQAIKSERVTNYNWRSLVVPVVEGETTHTEMEASILQNWAIQTSGSADIPWGSSSLRGSFVFIVPRGKEAYLHHEMRIRRNADFPHYWKGPWDGQRVPDAEATLNNILHPATRLNALQVIIEPTFGSTDFNPEKDPYRNQLDPAVDTYPQAYPTTI